MPPRAFFYLSLFLCYANVSSETQSADSFVDVVGSKKLEIKNFKGKLENTTADLFQNIEELKINECNIVLDLGFFNPMKKLRKITIMNSRLKKAENGSPKCCEFIEELVLINNSLPNVNWKRMSERKYLKSFHYSGDKAEYIPPNILPNSQLKNLTIRYSKVKSIDPKAFSSLKSLEYLNLRGNEISNITKEMLEPLVNLKSIDLSENYLEEITMDHLPSLPNLEELHIAHNPIQKLNLNGTKELFPKLKFVNITGVKTTGDFIYGGVLLV